MQISVTEIKEQFPTGCQQYLNCTSVRKTWFLNPTQDPAYSGSVESVFDLESDYTHRFWESFKYYKTMQEGVLWIHYLYLVIEETSYMLIKYS